MITRGAPISGNPHIADITGKIQLEWYLEYVVIFIHQAWHMRIIDHQQWQKIRNDTRKKCLSKPAGEGYFKQISSFAVRGDAWALRLCTRCSYSTRWNSSELLFWIFEIRLCGWTVLVGEKSWCLVGFQGRCPFGERVMTQTSEKIWCPRRVVPRGRRRTKFSANLCSQDLSSPDPVCGCLWQIHPKTMEFRKIWEKISDYIIQASLIETANQIGRTLVKTTS